MRFKIDVTAQVQLDEIKDQLIEELSLKDLIEFVISLGDDMSLADEYWLGLRKKLNKMDLE